MRFLARCALVLFVLGSSAACASVSGRGAGPTAIPTTVSIQPAQAPVPQATAEAVSNGLNAVGTLVSANQAVLSFQLGGQLKAIEVKEGDHVKPNTVLASLDTTSLELQVAQAQAALDSAAASLANTKAGPTADEVGIAKSNLDRAKAALDQAQAAYDQVGGASNPAIVMAPQALALEQAQDAYQGALGTFNLTIKHPTDTELKIAQAQADQAQAALDLAKQNVANAEIVAPFDGTILSIDPHAGEYVAPGTPVVALADLSRMQVSVHVDENSLSQIRVGQSVSISVDVLPGQTLTGRVSQIDQSASATTGIVSVPVTVDIDPTQAAIYPGLSASVTFNTGK